MNTFWENSIKAFCYLKMNYEEKESQDPVDWEIC